MTIAPSTIVLRAAVERVASATSIRAVSRSIGMSHGGLVKFLEGSEPRSSTRRRLVEWYAREGSQAHGDSSDAIDAAVALLLEGLPDGLRGDGRALILNVVSEIFRRAGVDVPPWAK